MDNILHLRLSLLNPVPPRWLSGEESTCRAGDAGLISGSGRSPGEENGNPFLHSCLGNPTEAGAWRATVHGLQRVRQELETEQQLNPSQILTILDLLYRLESSFS